MSEGELILFRSQDGKSEVQLRVDGDTRMRILEHNREWVLNIIGSANAIRCTSLPRGVRAQASS